MNLKEIRIMRNLKVQEVSDFLCCLPSVYSRYETGKREPSVDVLLKLSRLYGVSVDYLMSQKKRGCFCRSFCYLLRAAASIMRE